MTTKRRPYNTYPREFKLEALRLMAESDRPTSEIAMSLGIRRNLLYKWKEQMTTKDMVPSARRGRPKKEAQSEMTTLQNIFRNVSCEEDPKLLLSNQSDFASVLKSTFNSKREIIL